MRRILLLIALILPVNALSAQPSVELRPAQKQLDEAIDKLDIAGVREALRSGADPNGRYQGRGASVLSRIGITLFTAPSVSSELEEQAIAVYDLLFEAGAQLRANDREILIYPAFAGLQKVTKYLLDRGADPNAQTSGGDTPVRIAIRYGHPALADLLVANGARRLDPKIEAQIRMIVAAERGDLVALRRELSRGAEVNSKDPTGERALVTAVKAGRNLRIVRELLKLGADPNLPQTILHSESSALHAAVYAGEERFEYDDGPPVVDALLKAGARVSSTTYDRKQTPLHIAARSRT